MGRRKKRNENTPKAATSIPELISSSARHFSCLFSSLSWSPTSCRPTSACPVRPAPSPLVAPRSAPRVPADFLLSGLYQWLIPGVPTRVLHSRELTKKSTYPPPSSFCAFSFPRTTHVGDPAGPEHPKRKRAWAESSSKRGRLERRQVTLPGTRDHSHRTIPFRLDQASIREPPELQVCNFSLSFARRREETWLAINESFRICLLGGARRGSTRFSCPFWIICFWRHRRHNPLLLRAFVLDRDFDCAIVAGSLFTTAYMDGTP